MSDTITVSDEETGLSVSLPIPPGTSVISPAGRAVFNVALAMLDARVAETKAETEAKP